MKRAKIGYNSNSNSIDLISELPKDILRRILYFMSQKEAAQTSVLSRSWRYIWYTRPNLDLSDTIFGGNKQDFLSVVDKLLQRYCDRRMFLQEFQLSISLNDSDYESVSFLEKWIPVLTTIGVKEFRLFIYPKHSLGSVGFIDLPSVVFEAKSLQVLHVDGFVLSQKTIERTILSKHLKKLHVQQVDIEDEIFQKIISSCPLIETMFLESCLGLRNIKVNNLRHLKNFSFRNRLGNGEERCSIEIYPPSLETVKITFGSISFSEGADFRNLNVLHLSSVKLSLEHISSCKFPSLKRLTLLFCDGLKEIQLFIDAPNILHFNYVGTFVPSISFATTCREWNSDICVRSDDASSSSWFLKINELLRSLRQSNICLGINYMYRNNVAEQHIIHGNFDLVPDNGCYKPVLLESLKLKCRCLSYLSPLLNGLLRICRPRIISEILYLTWKLEVTKSLCRILMQRESGAEDELCQLWLRDLEEVSLEFKDTNLEEVSLEFKDTNQNEWRPTTLPELLCRQKDFICLTRFALKWRQTL